MKTWCLVRAITAGDVPILFRRRATTSWTRECAPAGAVMSGVAGLEDPNPNRRSGRALGGFRAFQAGSPPLSGSVCKGAYGAVANLPFVSDLRAAACRWMPRVPEASDNADALAALPLLDPLWENRR